MYSHCQVNYFQFPAISFGKILSKSLLSIFHPLDEELPLLAAFASVNGEYLL